jgi:hypothetical protein
VPWSFQNISITIPKNSLMRGIPTVCGDDPNGRDAAESDE